MTSGAPRVMVLVVILRGTRGDNLAAWSCMVRHAVMFCCRFPGRPLCVFYVEFLRHLVLIVSGGVTITLKQLILVALIEKLPSI